MTENRFSMFSDRRAGNDRRKHQLPMPAGLDRRDDSRRSRSFQSQPWWLSIDYAHELVAEKPEMKAHIEFERPNRGFKKTRD